MVFNVCYILLLHLDFPFILSHTSISNAMYSRCTVHTHTVYVFAYTTWNTSRIDRQTLFYTVHFVVVHQFSWFVSLLVCLLTYLRERARDYSMRLLNFKSKIIKITLHGRKYILKLNRISRQASISKQVSKVMPKKRSQTHIRTHINSTDVNSNKAAYRNVNYCCCVYFADICINARRSEVDETRVNWTPKFKYESQQNVFLCK